MAKGWYNESKRHALARKGIKTKVNAVGRRMDKTIILPQIQYVGIDEWNRGIYKDKKTGTIFKEVDGNLTTITKKGEPLKPIKNGKLNKTQTNLLNLRKEMNRNFTDEEERVLKLMNYEYRLDFNQWSLQWTKKPSELFVAETQLGYSKGKTKKVITKALDTFEKYPSDIVFSYLGYE
jgi:hypothetical protein